MGGDRESIGSEPELLTDPTVIAQREAENAVRQFDAVLDLIDQVARDGRPFKLRPSTILALHKEALEGLSRYAGTWRPSPVTIGKSKHAPPHESQVPELIEKMCDWVNDHWKDRKRARTMLLRNVAAQLDSPLFGWKWADLPSSFIPCALRASR